MSRIIPLSCLLALLLVLAAKPISAADSDAAETGSADVHQQQHSPPVEVLKRMDRDRDGVLEPSEIAKGAKSFVADLAKDASLDHRQPFRLDLLARRLDLRRIHAASIQVVIRLDRDLDGTLKPNEVPKEARAFVQQLVEEAGHDHSAPIKLANLHESHMKRFAELPDNHRDGSNVKGAKFASVKAALAPARILISLYDTNEDGVLIKREWTRLHRDWTEDDENSDGKLTDQEVARKLFLFSRADLDVADLLRRVCALKRELEAIEGLLEGRDR